MHPRLALALFLALTVGGGLVIGIGFPPGAWYETLTKPSFNPPNWLFGPVWTTLYVMIGIAGWRCWRRRARSALTAWRAQLACNFAWSPLFFGAHRMDIALGVSVLMLASILTFIALNWRNDRVTALLFAPYAVWVSFATVLNGTLLALNG